MRKDIPRPPPEAPTWQEGSNDDPEQAVQELKRGLARAKALVRRAQRSLTTPDDDGAIGTRTGPRR